MFGLHIEGCSASLESRLAAIDTRFASIENRVVQDMGRLDSKMEGNSTIREKAIAEADERVEKMRRAAEEFEGRMESMRKAGVDFEKQVADGLEKLTAMGFEVDSRVQTTHAGLTSKVEEVSTRHVNTLHELTRSSTVSARRWKLSSSRGSPKPMNL